MASARVIRRTVCTAITYTRPFTTTTARFADVVPLNSRANDTAKAHRKFMMEKQLNPHMTNTNSTIANDFPSVGTDKAPPELLSSVDPDHVPKDSVPENTKRMTGGTQEVNPMSGPNAELAVGGTQEAKEAKPSTSPNAELAVGEIEGGSFKVEPMRRTGEDVNTTRARLLCPLFICTSTLTLLIRHSHHPTQPQLNPRHTH